MHITTDCSPSASPARPSDAANNTPPQHHASAAAPATPTAPHSDYPPTPLERQIHERAARLSSLQPAELLELAGLMRAAILDACSTNGGHVSPNLGVVELSVALWRVFDPYSDRLFWDVSHQIYPHKLLSGRSLRNLRQLGGPSGYSEPAESAADVLCAGHSSTSISLAVGAAKALALAGLPHKAVAIIGDGAMGSGLAYEALNELGALKLPAVVVLNDNKMSIAAPIGALSRFLSQSIASSAYQRFRRGVLKALEHLPDSARFAAKRVEDSLKLASPAGMFFEELGLCYIGPIDGHDIAACERALRLASELEHPALVHIITQKGRGYAPAECDATGAWHGVGPFELEGSMAQIVADSRAQDALNNCPANIAQTASATNFSKTREFSENSMDLEKLPQTTNFPKTGEFSENFQRASAKAQPEAAQQASAAKKLTATAAFSQALAQIMRNDERVVAITAAMPSGTGLDAIMSEFGDRCWDVGIAEAHACTQSAALAERGLRPVVAVYSTFLQRAIDSVAHDICLNNQPVTLALDRAGIVGQDGKTHQGLYDLALLRCWPNMRLFAPVGPRSMRAILAHCTASAGPRALRYARGAFALDEEFDGEQIAPHFLHERGSRVLALGWGEGVADALAVGDAHGFDVANLVCAKPLDGEFLRLCAARYERLLVFSHTARAGGLAEMLALEFANLSASVAINSYEFSDAFVPHGQTSDVLRSLGRDANSLIAETARWAQ